MNSIIWKNYGTSPSQPLLHHNWINVHHHCHQSSLKASHSHQFLVSSVSSVPIVQPLQCSTNPVRSQLQPSSAVSMTQPLQCSLNPARSQVQPASAVPMIVLPILPIPEQFQSYAQYLEAFNFWYRWHSATDPNSLGLIHIYQTMN